MKCIGEKRMKTPSLSQSTQRYSNLELITEIQNGSAAAAVAFHQRFGNRISRLVWSLLGADSEHDDVVNNIFVSIIESIGSIKDPDRLAAWVDSVTFHVTRKELRRRTVRRQVQFDTDILDTSQCKKSFESTLVSKRFYKVMNQLKPEDRMIFIFKHFENFNLEEISQMSGWSLSTTRRKIKRAETAFEKLASRDMFLKSRLGGSNNVD